MTIKYFYACDNCGHEYAEQRRDSESQFFTNCHSCSNGTYIEVSSEVIEEIIEEVVNDETPSE